MAIQAPPGDLVKIGETPPHTHMHAHTPEEAKVFNCVQPEVPTYSIFTPPPAPPTRTIEHLSGRKL